MDTGFTRERSEIDICKLIESVLHVLVIVSLADKIDFSCFYIVIFDFLFNHSVKIVDSFAEVFVLLVLENFAKKRSAQQTVDKIQKREKGGVADDFAEKKITVSLIEVAVRKKEGFATKGSLQRLDG